MLQGVGPIRAGYDVVRILVAVVLLVAAGLKAYQLASEPVIGTGLLDNRLLLMAAVEFELLFGFWLLAGILPKPSWAAAVACFSLFTCISLYKAFSGYATCGCFGRVPVNPWYTAGLDFAVVFSLLRWHPPVSASHLLTVRRSTAALALWLLVGLPAGIAMGNYTDTALSDAGKILGDGKIVVLEPQKWIDKRFPLLDYIDIGDTLAEGKWLVLLYHSDCPHCQETIKNLSRDILLKREDARVALIEAPPYGETKSQAALSNAGMILGRLEDARDWSVITPTKVWLDDSEVAAVTMGNDNEGKN